MYLQSSLPFLVSDCLKDAGGTISSQGEAMIRIQTEDFDTGAEIAALRGGRTDAGAIVAFVGTVREHAKNGAITAMTLEHYPGMTGKELERIEAEAHERWPLLASLVVHRTGRLAPGDNIVLVVTLSTHRQAAFESAEFLMDYLKTSAPFWKTEETAEGSSHWVAASESDDAYAARWTKR
jgi:molybdopterin synthase catalytic subunit